MTFALRLPSTPATWLTNAAPSWPAEKGTPTVRRGGLVMRPSSNSRAGLQPASGEGRVQERPHACSSPPSGSLPAPART